MKEVSNAELEVLKVIWEKKETNSKEIIKTLENCHWNDNTIRTLINRLIAKKAIGISKKEGKIYYYVPITKKREYTNYSCNRFISQFFNGSVLEFMKFLNNEKYCEEIPVSIEFQKDNKNK